MKQRKNPERAEDVWSEEQLRDALSSSNKIELQIQKKLLDLKGHYTVMFVVSQDSLSQLRSSLLKSLTKKMGLNGIVVSLSLSASKLLKTIEENRVDEKKVTVIDASNQEEEKKENVIYVGEESDLNAL